MEVMRRWEMEESVPHGSEDPEEAVQGVFQELNQI